MSFQSKFNQITYRAIGDDTALNFFKVEGLTGVVTTTDDLKAENVDNYNVSKSSVIFYVL